MLMDAGLPETSIQVEHHTRTLPQGEHILQPVITDFYIYLFLFPDWAVKGLVLVICVLRCLLVGRPTQRHYWNWVIYDLWPGSANISTVGHTA